MSTLYIMEHSPPFYISVKNQKLEVQENYILIKKTTSDSITFELKNSSNQNIQTFNLADVDLEEMNGGSNIIDTFTSSTHNDFNSSMSISDAGDDLKQMNGGLNNYWYKSNKRNDKQKKNISIRNRNAI